MMNVRQGLGRDYGVHVAAPPPGDQELLSECFIVYSDVREDHRGIYKD